MHPNVICLKTPKLGILKFLNLWLLALWKAIIYFSNLWLRWGLKKSCSPCQEDSNDILHATCTLVFQCNSWILVGGNQIGILTLGPSFGHHLCFKYSNESCEPIFDIYISRAFQCYKELFNPMYFDLWNISLNYLFKDSKFHRDSTSQSESPLGSVWVHSLTLLRMQMWLLGCSLNLHLSMPLVWSWAQG